MAISGKCTFGTLTDGSSNTIMLAECAIGRNGSSLCPVKGGLATEVGWNQGSNPTVCLARVGLNNILIDPCKERQWCNWLGRGTSLGRCSSASTRCSSPSLDPMVRPAVEVNGENWDIPTAGSHHPTGCHVALCDGSVRFVTENIDTGDPNQIPPDMGGRPQDYSGPSLWGVWGALGTTRGHEQTREF